MPPKSTNVIRFQKKMKRQVALNAEAELFGIGSFEVRLYGLQGAERSGRACLASGNIRQIAVVIRDAGYIGWIIQRIESGISLHAVIENSEPSTKDGLVVQRVSEPSPGSPGAVARIHPPRRPVGNRENCRIGGIRH